MKPIYTAALAAVPVLSACGGGSSGGAAGSAAALNASTVAADGTATATRADVSRHDDGRIILSMTDGPLDGMTVICADEAMGDCTVVAPDTEADGTLLQRMSGDYTFVGNFQVVRTDDDAPGPSGQLVHAALPEADADITPTLPEGTVSYTGRFAAGAGLASGEEGLASGTAQIDAAFGSGVLTVALDGQLENGGAAVSASFGGVPIDGGTAGFAADDGTTLRFQGDPAGGDIRGAFYGPDADEVGGVFDIGNDAGGMSGVLLGCAGARDVCISD